MEYLTYGEIRVILRTLIVSPKESPFGSSGLRVTKRLDHICFCVEGGGVQEKIWSKTPFKIELKI